MGTGRRGVEEVRLDALLAEHLRGLPGKQVGAAAAVVGDDHAPAPPRRAGYAGKRPGPWWPGARCKRFIRLVPRAQHAPHARGAKTQLCIEAILNLGVVAADAFQLRHRFRIGSKILQPLRIALLNVPWNILLLSLPMRLTNAMARPPEGLSRPPHGCLYYIGFFRYLASAGRA